MGSNLRMMALRVLQEEPRSGYGIVKRIEEKTGWKPSYGSIYPVLEDMQEKGVLAVEAKGRKKIYSLTKKGKKKASEWESKREELLESMQENVKVVAELMDQDMSAVIRLLGEFKEGKDPLAQLSPEIFEFRNLIFKRAIEGLSDEETKELKKMLRKNIRKLEEIG